MFDLPHVVSEVRGADILWALPVRHTAVQWQTSLTGCDPLVRP